MGNYMYIYIYILWPYCKYSLYTVLLPIIANRQLTFIMKNKCHLTKNDTTKKLHNLKLPKQQCACSHYRSHKIKFIFGLKSLYLWPILYLIPLFFAFIIPLCYLQKRIKQPVNTTILSIVFISAPRSTTKGHLQSKILLKHTQKDYIQYLFN